MNTKETASHVTLQEDFPYLVNMKIRVWTKQATPMSHENVMRPVLCMQHRLLFNSVDR